MLTDRSKLGVVVLFALVAVLLSGCDASVVNVRGNVTFNGEPVPTGDIVFRGDEKTEGGKIVDGKYELEVASGLSRVEITAYRETGKIDRSNPGSESPEIEMYIPEEYNVRTTLTADTSSGENTFDFDLRSKEK